MSEITPIKVNLKKIDYKKIPPFNLNNVVNAVTETLEDINFNEPKMLETNEDLIGPHSEPSSQLTRLSDGQVIGYTGLYNKNRETGSTIKFITGYLGLIILGIDYNVPIFQWTIDRCEEINKSSNAIYHEAGEQVSMQFASASGFPMSDNVMAYSIAVAIGIEKCGINPYNEDGTENYERIEEAYNSGLEYMNNELRNMGYIRTTITDAAGFNTERHFSYDNYGYANDEAGSSTREISMIVNEAVSNPIVADTLINMNEDFRNQAFSASQDVIDRAQNYGISCNPGVFFTSSPEEGVYFIKSGTQGYKSAIFGVVYEGERYIFVINGVSTKGDYLAEALYEIDSGLGSNFYEQVENINNIQWLNNYLK